MLEKECKPITKEDVQGRIEQAKWDMKVDFLGILFRWLDVMKVWSVANEQGHMMHVVVDDDGKPYCTVKPGADDFCWEYLIAANMRWSDLLHGYIYLSERKWHVVGFEGRPVNIWTLAKYDDMREALERAIEDRYINWHQLRGFDLF